MMSVTPPGASASGPPNDDAAVGGPASGSYVAENRFRQIFEAAPFALCYADRRGAFRACNQAFRNLFGLSEEECRGLTFRDITYPDDVAESERLVGDLRTRGAASVLLEARFRDGSGGTFWAQTSVYLLHDEADEPVGTVAMLTDVTERKRRDAERARHAEEVEAARSVAESRVERLVRIARDLEAARSCAEEATKQKSEFLAVMSHEIRTPMNGVIGMTDLLLQTELLGDQRELVETIRTSGESLLGVINGILDFSKIEAGRIELEEKPFEICRCIEAAMSLVIPQAATKGLSVAYLIDDGVPDMVTGDILRLRQILVNVLSNAIKFTEEGEVVLAVGLEETEHGERIRFSVRDTGIGIAEDVMSKLFKTFSQIDASTSRKYGGTGLGLAISKRLTEMLGGEMWAESTVGEGSTFHFTIRFENPKSVVKASLPDVSGRRVLVVDRHEATREMLRRQLAPYDVDVTTAASGTEALAMIKERSFDLAFVEAGLPTLDGPTLARIIAQVPGMQNLKVVFLHRLGQHVLVQGVQAAGMMAKPVKNATLHDVIARTLDDTTETNPSMPASADARSTMDEVPGLRVLLAEDNPVNQKVAVRMLSKLGYEAVVANNGVEALERLETTSFDVVLMDIMMPEMDGIEATRRIIEGFPEDRRPRIIALTANAMRGDRERCLDAGMDDYLAKPLRVDQLKEALKGCIPAGASSATSQPPSDSPDEAEPVRSAGDGLGGDGANVGVAASLPSINLNILRELEDMMGDEDPNFLASIVLAYLDDADDLMASIRSAVSSKHGPALQRAAHTLKSSSAMFGAAAMAATCNELELIAADGRMDEAPVHLKLLERQYLSATRELKTQVSPA